MKPMIFAGLAASLLTASAAYAAGVDYYIKIPPIEGESEAMKPGIEPDEIDARASAATKGGNAETEFKVEKGEKARGNPDRALTTGHSATDDGHKDWINLLSVQAAHSDPSSTRRSGYRSRPGRKRPDTPGNLTAPAKDPVAIGLLLPAVQKVRVASAATPAWQGCKAGQELPGVEIMEGSTGRIGRILDATVSECASEHVSFNFSKIEWD